MIANSNEEGRGKMPSFHPAAARSRRKPSPRNMEIYEAVRLLGQGQAEVAARHGMNQQRVSQICQQVERWREWAASAPDQEAIAAEAQRERLLAARKRQEQVLLVALTQAAQTSQTLVSERRVTDHRGTQVDRTEKEMPVSPGWLRIALEASSSVARLGDKLGVDVQSSELERQIDELLATILARQEAHQVEREGYDGEAKVPEPLEGATSSTSSETKAERNEIGAGIGAEFRAPKHCRAVTCGENHGAADEAKKQESGDGLAIGESLVNAHASVGLGTPIPKSRVETARVSNMATLPREVQQRRARFLRGG